MKSAAVRFRKGDVLYGRLRPYLNKVALPDFDGLASSEFIVLPGTECISSSFLKHRLSAPDFVSFASHLNEGDRPRVSFEQIGQFIILIPPPREQRRIVTKIDSLLSELDAGIESLEKARAQLSTYRQSILKHAFEGKLTAQWHEIREGLLDGTRLLQKILSERRTVWNDDQLRQPNGTAQRVSRRIAYREPVTPRSAELPSIPPSWCWATVDQLVTEGLSNGRSVKGAESGFPVLRLTAFRNGEIDKHECKIGAWTEDDARRFLIREGDILVARGSGSLKLVGIGGLVRALGDPVAYPDTMIRIRVSRYVDREFFCFLWNSRIVRRQIEKKARTTAGIFKVNQQDLKTILIPIPPREQQLAISSAIRRRFASIDHASGRVERQIAKAETLRQSILKEALCGHLVPQDRSDEPASMLLERIRAERAQLRNSSARKKGAKVTT